MRVSSVLGDNATRPLPFGDRETPPTQSVFASVVFLGVARRMTFCMSLKSLIT